MKLGRFGLLAILLAAPALAQERPPDEANPQQEIDDWQAAVPQDPNEATESWVDSSHGYATDQAQALSEWMDSFFSVPDYEVEQPESQLRLDFITDWDEQEGTNYNARLRGKLQLPGLSKRLNLVFSDDSGDDLNVDTNNNDDRNQDNGVSFLYEVAQTKRSRLDLTMGIRWNQLRPGVRYRYGGTLGELSSYRLTQRLQYDSSDKFYATSQAELNRALSQNSIVRWNNKAVYGEETKGVEWVTRLSVFERHKTYNRRHELGINYFTAINGVSDPDYVKNYRVGVLFRRQVFREYLFLELEPAYNYRKKNEDAKRQFAWSIAVRFSIALERNLDKTKSTDTASNSSYEAGQSGTTYTPAEPAATGSRHQPAPDASHATEDAL